MQFRHTDTVHHFDNQTVDTESEYTKSMESEVEDAIKDILMIGRPHKPGSRSKNNIDEKKEDPLADAWNYVESSFTAVGQALGLEDDDEKVVDEQTVDDETVDDDDEVPQPTKVTVETRTTATKTTPAPSKGFQKFFDSATDFLLGSPVERTTQPAAAAPVEEPIPRGVSLEDDLRLIELALQAARSTHKLKGLEYDETHELDIVQDIQFQVVDLSLPLGLVFQENDGGCWVTKVLPDGKAANKIKVGDQLAAIDGISAVRRKVDEIADWIRSKEEVVELTFLRYVGPIHSLTKEEEGYEVQAKSSSPVKKTRSTGVVAAKTTTTPVAAAATKPTPLAKSRTAPEARQEKRRFRLFGRRR